MPSLTPDPLVYPPPLWLLTLPPPAPTPCFSEPEVAILDLLATITGAPSAVPPELWDAPIPQLSLPATRDLLKQICSSLSERIPFLAWDFLEWEEDTEALFPFRQIPVDPVGVDICNGEVVGCGAVMTWVAAVAGYATDTLPYPLPEAMPPGFEVLELTEFVATLHEEHPLAALADVIDVLDHTTGTFFLDACPACWHSHDEDITDWTDENVTWLEEDATRALAILERIDALEAWVKAEPERMTLVWQALLDAHIAQEAQEVASSPPKTLIEVWGLAPEGENASDGSETGGWL